MNIDDKSKGSLVPARSTALARTGSQALVSRGLRDLERVEQFCTEPEARFLFCLEHKCFHDQCPDVLHLDFALIPTERIVRLPHIVPHVWTGPDDVASGLPPGCSFCGESDPAQFGKPCPQRNCNTWYEILGVPEGADENQIDDAYRELAKEWSPEEMRWLNAACAVLRDPAKRQQYDAELVQHHLNDAEWWTSKGNSLDAQGLHSDALECHEKALTIDPLCTSAWINKGFCLDELGKLPAALECYRNAAEIDGSNYLPLVRKADILGRMGRFAEAISCYDTALQVSTESTSAWMGKGSTLHRVACYEEAIACFEKVLQIAHQTWTDNGRAYVYSGAWNAKGASLYRLGRYPEAIECYEEAIALDPEFAQAWYNKGNGMREMKQFNGAIACYDRAIGLDPGLAKAWNNKGLCLRELGRLEEALSCYESALGCNPPETLGWYNKALVQEHLGRTQDAVRSYEQYLSVAPPDGQHTVNREHARARVRALKKLIENV